MIFLIGFSWHVAASFAFLLAILTSNWATYQIITSSGNTTVQHGIFYVCEPVLKTSIYETTRCLSVIDIDPSNNTVELLKYPLSMASASLAITCAGLSLITLWLSGIYFNRRTRDKCTQCFLISVCISVFITFCASVAVWILIISEILAFSQKVERSTFRWPMWLGIGASGGFLMGFISILISFCKGLSCTRNRSNAYRGETQF
ncbi:unnamed protein product [Rotaria sp. Silwood2]|nr:unnamed protein product [Rotaria sp. Silwood2]CAF3142675.1 unnamed protein product [Rotaria sp. Silwood2]CAF3289135.1 unnamed protein product [Rotaria sp. Silwood2]CAF3468779.1 unnamed protein product [Rotaria sp. Silwood2]CAF4202526.1 unnamed protein product [Rotaria sp. Silwood2]